MRWGKFKLVLTGLCLAGLSAVLPVQGRTVQSQVATATASIGELPKQATETYALIFKGGPFPYEKDGTVFGNRERLLPGQKRGYYREYTVKTPFAKNRGVRRIVCGGPATQPDACFYTADHYASFRKIVQ